MIKCNRIDCLHNSSKECVRGEILVDKSKIDGEEIWVCRCFSNEGISGHIDFSRLLKPDGTPKGGSVTDSEAEKMYKDSLKFKSFDTWHKDGKEPKRKKK